MKYSVTKALFQSGEISPYYLGRQDANEYISGCRVMRNAMPDARGGFRKRPGTQVFKATDTCFRMLNYKYGEMNLVLFFFYDNKIECRYTDGSPAPGTLTVTGITQLVDQYTRFAVHKGIIYLVNPNKPVWTVSLTYSGGSISISAAAMSFVGPAPDSDAGSVMQFNQSGDYPSAICFKGGRMYLGATLNQPNTTWASRTPSGGSDRFNDFTFYDGTIDDPVVSPSHAIEVAETDNEDSALLWYMVQKKVIAGYEHSILIETDNWATPEDFDLDIAINEGSSSIPAKAYKNYTIFASPDGRRISLLVWDDDLDSYTTINIAKNAPHMLASGIKAFDITISPDPVIWIITNNGGLCSCSIDLTSGFVAWTAHPRQAGSYEDILAIGAEEHDKVAFRIAYPSSAPYDYTLEIMDLNDEDSYSDCFIRQEYVSPTTQIKVSSQLDGVHGLVAWTDKGILAVSDNGSYVGSDYYRTVGSSVSTVYCVGLPIRTEVQLLPPALPANGSSMFKLKRISRIGFKYYESYGGTVVVEGQAQDILLEKYGSYKYGANVNMVTDDVSIDIISKNTKDGSITVLHDEPVPFNILAIAATFEILEV